MAAADSGSAGQIPTFDQLLNPVLAALRDLGGSGSNNEILERVIQLLEIPQEVAEFSHLGSHTQTALGYRVAWARSYLKKYGIINNSRRGVWGLTEKGRRMQTVDPREVTRAVRASDARRPDAGDDTESEVDWQEELVTLMQEMEPGGFERLCQWVLREAGFAEVEVEGRSGDGGIDGRGLARIGGLLTFPILFQCKRYRDAVGSQVVRDFRGAMAGRADRGLIMTTGRFTKEAHVEARRVGNQPIDLVDGVTLADKLREYSLGVKSTEHVTYDVEIDRSWFASL